MDGFLWFWYHTIGLEHSIEVVPLLYFFLPKFMSQGSQWCSDDVMRPLYREKMDLVQL